MKIYTTIKQKKEKLLIFATELEILINETIDFNDITEIKFDIFYNGCYWKINKKIFEAYDNVPHLIEIRVNKTNYDNINELSKGERVDESCWVYLKDNNKIYMLDKMSIIKGDLLIMGYNYYKF